MELMKDVVDIKTEFLQKFQYFYMEGKKIYYDLCDEREYCGFGLSGSSISNNF